MPHRTSSTRNDYEQKINYDWPYRVSTLSKVQLQEDENVVPKGIQNKKVSLYSKFSGTRPPFYKF